MKNPAQINVNGTVHELETLDHDEVCGYIVGPDYDDDGNIIMDADDYDWWNDLDQLATRRKEAVAAVVEWIEENLPERPVDYNPYDPAYEYEPPNPRTDALQLIDPDYDPMLPSLDWVESYIMLDDNDLDSQYKLETLAAEALLGTLQTLTDNDDA